MEEVLTQSGQDIVPRRHDHANGFSTLSRVCLGLIAAAGGCMLAQGNGISPLAYFVMGLLVIPFLMSRLTWSRSWPRVNQLLVVAVCGLMCFAAAYHSSRQSPRLIFTHIFDQEPPSTTTNLVVKKQWYDGKIWLASFRITNEEFDNLVSQAKLHVRETVVGEMTPDRIRNLWYSEVGQWGGLAYGFWQYNKPPKSIAVFTRVDSEGYGDPERVNVVRDTQSGDVWAVRLD